jgi:hypothetical protein
MIGFSGGEYKKSYVKPEELIYFNFLLISPWRESIRG